MSGTMTETKAEAKTEKHDKDNYNSDVILLSTIIHNFNVLIQLIDTEVNVNKNQLNALKFTLQILDKLWHLKTTDWENIRKKYSCRIHKRNNKFWKCIGFYGRSR